MLPVRSIRQESKCAAVCRAKTHRGRNRRPPASWNALHGHGIEIGACGYLSSKFRSARYAKRLALQYTELPRIRLRRFPSGTGPDFIQLLDLCLAELDLERPQRAIQLFQRTWTDDRRGHY